MDPSFSKPNIFPDEFSDDDLFDVGADGFLESRRPKHALPTTTTGVPVTARQTDESIDAAEPTEDGQLKAEIRSFKQSLAKKGLKVYVYPSSAQNDMNVSESENRRGQTTKTKPAEIFTPATTIATGEGSSSSFEVLDDCQAPVASGTKGSGSVSYAEDSHRILDREGGAGEADSGRGRQEASSGPKSPYRSRSPVKWETVTARATRGPERPLPSFCSELSYFKHALHCVTIPGAEGQRHAFKHCQIQSQLSFDFVHDTPAVKDYGLKLYVANWCTEWMHDSLVRETGIPESFFTGWRQEIFRSNIAMSPLDSREISMFFDYPHLHVQNQAHDTFPRPPNVLRYSPGGVNNFGVGSITGEPGFERWGIQRLCVWLKDESKQGGPPKYTMVVFLDKPPQWFNVKQREDVVDLYSHLIDVVQRESLHGRAVNDAFWLISELLRASVEWPEFNDCARRYWNCQLNRSLSVPYEEAVLDLHRLQEEFSDCLHIINSHIGFVKELKLASTVQCVAPLHSSMNLGPSASINFSCILDQLNTSQDTIQSLRYQIENHIQMLRNSFSIRNAAQSSNVRAIEQGPKVNKIEETPAKHTDCKRLKRDNKCRRKTRRRAKMALITVGVMFFTNNINFELLGILSVLASLVIFSLAVFRPERLKRFADFILAKVNKAVEGKRGQRDSDDRDEAGHDGVAQGDSQVREASPIRRPGSEKVPQQPVPREAQPFENTDKPEVVSKSVRRPPETSDAPLCRSISPLPPPPPPSLPCSSLLAGALFSPNEPPPLVNGGYSFFNKNAIHSDVPPGFATIMYIDPPPGTSRVLFDRHLRKYTAAADGTLRPFYGDTIMMREPRWNPPRGDPGSFHSGWKRSEDHE